MNVWNFEFRSLLFVCYLSFVICNLHQLPPLHIKNEDELNPKSKICNLQSKIHPLRYASSHSLQDFLNQPHQPRLGPFCRGYHLFNGSRLVILRVIYVGNH